MSSHSLDKLIVVIKKHFQSVCADNVEADVSKHLAPHMQEFIASDKDIVLEATVETTWETIEALLKNPFRLVGQPFGIKTNNGMYITSITSVFQGEDTLSLYMTQPKKGLPTKITISYHPQEESGLLVLLYLGSFIINTPSTVPPMYLDNIRFI